MARGTRAEWARRVARWVASGLTGAEFAAREGVKEATLRHWKWQLARDGRLLDGMNEKPRFLEVVGSFEPARPAPDDDAALELLLDGGRRLRIPRGFDEATLRRLLAVLEER
jgi:transposase-like protein